MIVEFFIHRRRREQSGEKNRALREKGLGHQSSSKGNSNLPSGTLWPVRAVQYERKQSAARKGRAVTETERRKRVAAYL